MPRPQGEFKNMQLRVMGALVVALAVNALAVESRAAGDLTLGFDLVADDVPPAAEPGPPAGNPENQFLSRFSLPWEGLDEAVGGTAADAVSRRLAWLDSAHHRLLVSLTGGPDPGLLASDSARLRTWTAKLALLARSAGPALVAVQPFHGGATGSDAETDAFILKQAAVALRSVRPDILLVAGTGADDAGAAWVEALYAAGAAAYVDGLAFEAVSGGMTAAAAARAAALRLRLDPGAALWFTGLRGEGSGPDSNLALAGRLAEAGAKHLIFAAVGPEADILAALQRRLPPGTSVMPGGGVSFEDAGGQPLPAAFLAWRFFDSGSARVQTVIVPGPAVPPGTQVIVDTFDVSSPLIHDPASGQDRFVTGALSDRAANRTRLPLGPVSGPVILEYRRFAAGGFGREDIEVGTERQLPVEEIMARHQAASAAADAAVDTVQADAVIEFHYAIAGSGASLDVAFRSRYFKARGQGAELEHLEMLVNGSRWKQEKLPQLPLIQPEKVVSVPLEIELRRQYAYRLRGRDEVGGRPAWKVDFSPAAAAAALYTGTAWIDTETFRLLKQSVVQTGLEPPVLSSEETNLYAEYAGRDGVPASLVTSVTAQQIWNTAGLNLRVNREVRFENVRLNGADFATNLQLAHDSNHQILRDTETGLRYLVKDDSGSRQVQEKQRTRSRFALGGAFFNEALDTPIPFAGINWFDYDFRGRGQQINAFLAGAANFVTWADPTFFGSHVDASASLGLIGFTSKDRYFVGGREREDLEVEGREQSLSLSLGVPLGSFFKLRGTYGLTYEHFERGDDTAAGFLVPEDTFSQSLATQLQFNRRGLTGTLQSEAARRQRWELWGDADPASTAAGTRQTDFRSDRQRYERYSASLSQDFFLRAFQKVRLAASWLGGHDLDRFSQYQFSFFSDRTRVRGFSGSGVRFDRGVLLRAAYTFNIVDMITFDATVDHALVDNELTAVEDQEHTGIGIAAKFIGPWGLIVQVDYGYALRSDIPKLEGEQEVQLLFLKIF